MGRCGTRSWRFSEHFKPKNLQSHWLSEIGCFPTANEIANLHFETCLKRSEKRQERVPHRPMQKRSYFSRFTNLFHKLKYF